MVKGCEGLVERAAIDQLMVPAWLPQIALVGLSGLASAFILQ